MEPILYARNAVKRYGRVVALDHCDFDLYPGEVLGVIGDNGAGKSTLIKALSGAIQLDTGDIHFETKKIHFSNPLEARSAGIETVYQNLALSPALSISDNMFLGREIRRKGLMGKLFYKLDHAEMERQSKQMLADLGLLTIQNIGQTVETLSGGQRQRIALARAILEDAPILVLDEATSALDSEVEALIQNALNRVMEGKTVLAIAHRLSTIARMDRIIVMDQGEIVEQGTHQALLDQNGLYARYWNRQSGGFIGVEQAAE